MKGSFEETIMAFCFQANVSQAEYERAHREYLKRMQLSHEGQENRIRRDLHVFRMAGKKRKLMFHARLFVLFVR
jgi:uncharacterized protein YxeA